jgi:outer membrane protein TolC
VVPITLDSVLHLTDEQNLQIGQARARVAEAEARLDLLGHGWLHPAQKVNAERKVWQQRAELSKITADTCLEAANTYVDLLAAHTARTLLLQTEKDLNRLLERAQKLAATEPGAQAEVARIRTEIEGNKQESVNFSVQGAAATAKLVYLLALDPCVDLVPVDCALAPYNLVDVRLPCCELVVIAISQGPGVQELTQMVAVIDAAAERSHGLTHVAPGGCSAPEDSGDDTTSKKCLGWMKGFGSNLFHSGARKRIMSAGVQQAHLALDDLQAKLAAGVQEARETILGASDEIQRGIDRVKYAQESRKLSQDRLYENVPGSSYSEVLLSLQALALAELKYIAALRDYDKAQLRLMILTGGHGPAAHCASTSSTSMPAVSPPPPPEKKEKK